MPIFHPPPATPTVCSPRSLTNVGSATGTMADALPPMTSRSAFGSAAGSLDTSTSMGSTSRPPDAPQSLGIHVSFSRPMSTEIRQRAGAQTLDGTAAVESASQVASDARARNAARAVALATIV